MKFIVFPGRWVIESSGRHQNTEVSYYFIHQLFFHIFCQSVTIGIGYCLLMHFTYYHNMK